MTEIKVIPENLVVVSFIIIIIIIIIKYMG